MLAEDMGLTARFVAADVYDASAALEATYDIVYTGVGALCWLPNIERWAAVVHTLLRPGGRLYLYESHPTEWIFDDAGNVSEHYFTPPAGFVEAGTVVYAAAANAQTAAMQMVQWNHPLGAVVTALARAGLRIDELRELDRTIVSRLPGLIRDDDGFFTGPPERPSLPLMYVLRATRSDD